mgnify:CR=1 FL=1
MFQNSIALRRVLAALTTSIVAGCIPTPPGGTARDPNRDIPDSFAGLRDTQNSGLIVWSEFFADAHLTALVETSLRNNQELNIAIQETLIANAEVMGRRGEYMPRLGFGLDGGVEHVGAFTSQRQSDEATGVDATLQDDTSIR